MGALLLGAFVVGQLVTVTPIGRNDGSISPTPSRAREAAATFDVIAPKSLPKGWIATSARFGPEAWHLGVLTADDKYIGLEQTTTSAKGIVDDFAPKSRAIGDGAARRQRLAGQDRIGW